MNQLMVALLLYCKYSKKCKLDEFGGHSCNIRETNILHIAWEYIWKGVIKGG